MLKLYAVVFCSTFLTTETYSSLILGKACGNSSDALEAVFQSAGSLLPGNCTFELTVRPNICGIRIDFKKFAFNQPAKKDIALAYYCTGLDLLEISVLGLPKISLSVLCGELSGQHVYVPTKDYDEPLLNVTIAQKLILTAVFLGIPGVKKPSWNIKLTQLQCPNVVNATAKLSLNLAPIGCLQYYVNKTGIFESMNYLNGLGHYIGDLNYAICFKRSPDTCGIKYTAIGFQLASNSNSSYGTERECDTLSLGTDISILPSTDSLIIPNGVSITAGLKVFASKYCGNSLKILVVKVTTQGPLFVSVITDGISDPIKNLEIGFKIKYELLTDCTELSL